MNQKTRERNRIIIKYSILGIAMNLLLAVFIKGAIPGANGGYVVIKDSVKA